MLGQHDLFLPVSHNFYICYQNHNFTSITEIFHNFPLEYNVIWPLFFISPQTSEKFLHCSSIFVFWKFPWLARTYNLPNYFTILWQKTLFSYTSNIAIIFSSVVRPSTVGNFLLLGSLFSFQPVKFEVKTVTFLWIPPLDSLCC